MSEIDKNRLHELAGEINAEHGKFRSAFKATYQHALRVGELLADAKAEVGHGGWSGWVAENCEFSMRTAQVYMRIAANREQVERMLNNAEPAHLSIYGVDKALASGHDEVASELPATTLYPMQLDKPYSEWTPTDRREFAEWDLEYAQREGWHRHGSLEEREQELERREERVRVMREVERLDWTGPNEANGFYNPAVTDMEPEHWLSERERTAEDLLVEIFTGWRYDVALPDWLPPPARNPYPRWVDAEAWLRVRSRVLADQRERAVRVVDGALWSAKGGRSGSLLPTYREHAAFLAENATKPELSGQASREKLTEYARLARGISALYAGLADGLAAEDA